MLIACIGIHSSLLGILMLSAPGFMLRLLGFNQPMPSFFPSQSGIFLLILGICYLMALGRPSFEVIILISKALAVLFLTVHCVFFAAPPLIWAADALDALMLVVFGGAVLWRNRHAGGKR